MEDGVWMGFQQFLTTHVVMDYIWEIFKGISPTIIALITIEINYRLGKRKELKEQTKKDMQRQRCAGDSVSICL